MAIYIPSSNFLFIQTPGTGSTSIESALLKLDGARIIGSKHDGLQELEPYLVGELSNAISISFVRNPFDWYVSEWWRLRTRYIWDLLDQNSIYSIDELKKKELISACVYDFDKWLDFVLIDMYERNLNEKTCIFEPWVSGVTYVEKYENIEHFPALLKRLFGIQISLPAKNVNSEKRLKPYSYFYTASSRNLIEDVWSITLEKFDYIFEEHIQDVVENKNKFSLNNFNFSDERQQMGNQLQYFKDNYTNIEGWMQQDIIPSAILLDSFQKNVGITGGVAEIGVHHGRFFILLHNLLQKEECSFAIDLFENQQDNIDCSGKGSKDVFLSNLAKFSENIHRAKLIQGDSLSMTPQQLMDYECKGIRLFSIDGGHTAEHTVNDIRLAIDLMAPGGVIFIDDYYNPHWPGVHIGVNRYFALDTPKFVPFAYRRDKLLLCSITWHKRYFDLFTKEFASGNTDTKVVSMYGYSVFVS